MSGARILLVLVLVVGGLLWAALVGPASAEDERGWEEAERAFAALAAELDTFEPIYEEVARHGIMIELKTAAQQLRERLAALRSERLALREDDSLPEGKRLPAYRELVKRSDVALAQLRSLRRSVEERYAFFQASNPLLLSTRRQRDLLAAREITDDQLRSRRDALGALFAALEGRAQQAHALLRNAPEQNRALAVAVVKDLARLEEDQRELMAALDG